MTTESNELLAFDPNQPTKLISWVGHTNFADGIVSYSYPTSLPSYYDTDSDGNFDAGYQPYLLSPFAAFTSQQQAAANQILEQSPTSAYRVSFSDVANIRFENTTGVSQGDITLALADVQSAAGRTFLPITGEWNTHGGDVWIDPSSTGANDVAPGELGYLNILHELGHAVGLQDTDIVGTTDDLAGNFPTFNNLKYTVMDASKNPHPDMWASVLPSGLQLLDIAALQELYGVNTSTRNGNNTGVDAYRIGNGFASSANIGFIYTIWDSAGIDAIDATGYADGVEIDLREGHFSSIGKNGDLSGSRVVWDSGSYDAGNVAIAYGTIIESAIGTALADHIIGNDSDNTITGNAGNDSLEGGAGSDTYFFNYGDERDTITDSSGIADVLRMGAGITVSNINISYSGDDLIINFSGHSGDRITIVNHNAAGGAQKIEKIIFDDLSEHSISGPNVINGSENGDGNLQGTNSADVINGLGGSDFIKALEGDDVLNGGDGNDHLFDGYGDDELYGHDGSDGFYLSPGQDYLDASGGSGNDSDSISADDTNAASLAKGLIPVNHGIIVDLSQNLILDDGFGNTETIISVENITGSSFGDILTAFRPSLSTSGGSYFFGRAGDDVLTGNIGEDVLHGEEGDDILSGVGGHDTLWAGTGNDILNGGAGNDELRGDDGNDEFHYNSGDGQDTIKDSSGNDFIRLGAGFTASNVILTNAGNNLEITFSGGGKITIENHNTGTNQVEKIVFSDLSEMSLVHPVVNGTNGVDTLTGSIHHDTISGLEGDDILSGGLGNDVLIGGFGNDSLSGGAGDDTYVFAAGDGYDTIQDTEGTNELKVASGLDPNAFDYLRIGNDLRVEIGSGVTIAGYFSNPNTISNIQVDGGSSYSLATLSANTITVPVDAILGTVGNNTLNGDALNNAIYGLHGADTLNGNDGNDILDGGAGNDTLHGGSGNDSAAGGLGDDSYHYESGDDIFEDTGGTDGIYLPSVVTSLSQLSFLRYSTAQHDLQIRVDDANTADSVYLGWITVSDQFLGPGTHIETLNFNSFDLTLANVYVSTFGTGGSDTIYGINYGANPDDVIYGFAGDNDIIHSGVGADTVYAGSGDDYLYGEDGGDGLLGEEDDDVIFGGNGADYIFGDANTAVAYGGNDVLYGENGNDWIEGGKGDDNISGGADSDILLGQEGADIISGDAGNDFIMGGAGNDYIAGGDGLDDLYGEGGADTFVFDATAFNNVDTIHDFSTGSADRLDISDILDGFYNPGTDAITDFVRITDNGTHSFLSVDQNGGGNSFTQIAQLSGVTNIAAGATATEIELQAMITAGTLLAA